MNTRDEQIQEIELSIQEAKKSVAFGEALDRLMRHKDFQTVIDEGYMTAEARRLTLLLGDPNLTDSQRDSVAVSLRAIGELHTFFLAKKSLAEQMRNAIEQAESELEVIHAESQEGDE